MELKEVINSVNGLIKIRIVGEKESIYDGLSCYAEEHVNPFLSRHTICLIPCIVKAVTITWNGATATREESKPYMEIVIEGKK